MTTQTEVKEITARSTATGQFWVCHWPDGVQPLGNMHKQRASGGARACWSASCHLTSTTRYFDSQSAAHIWLAEQLADLGYEFR